MVNDFVTRKVLAKLGMSGSFDELSDLETEYLVHISCEFSRLENEEQKKNARRSRKG